MARTPFTPRTGRLLSLAFPLVVVTALAAELKRPPQHLLPRLGYDVISLRRTADHRLYLSGRLDGQRRSFLVDTGWSHTAVKTSGETGAVNRSEIKLGRVTFPDQPVRRERLLMGGQPASFDVVLGLDFLRRHFAVIDCGAGRLFTRRAAASAEAQINFAETLRRGGFIAVDLRVRGNVALTCAAMVEGTSLELLVDSGAAWTCLDVKLSNGLGLTPLPSTTQLSGAGRAGTRNLPVVRVKSLRLGEVELTRIMVGLLDLTDWGLAREGTALGEVKGLLGGEILAGGQAVIDCGGMKLWLKPPQRR